MIKVSGSVAKGHTPKKTSVHHGATQSQIGQTYTHMGNLEMMFLECERIMEYPERTQYAHIEHANYLQKEPRMDLLVR